MKSYAERGFDRTPTEHLGYEAHALERRHPKLDLPDDVVFGVFDRLLERYRFTTRDAADDLPDARHEVGIDPEMLGRVFEGLMAGDRRGDTGTYYTPSAVVDRIVGTALCEHAGGDDAARRLLAGDASGLDAGRRTRLARALRTLTVLDPACGSGAFPSSERKSMSANLRGCSTMNSPCSSKWSGGIPSSMRWLGSLSSPTEASSVRSRATDRRPTSSRSAARR